MARGKIAAKVGRAACPHAAEGGVLATKNTKATKAMKPSGVAWLGDIPDGWELRRGKYLLSQISEPSSSQNKVALENIESGTGKYIDSNAILQGNGIAFTQGDILYGKLRPYLAKVWLAEFEGNAVGDFFVYRVATAYYNCYAKYVMLAPSFTAITNDSTYGAKMPRVSAEFIANLRFPLPPLPEQRAIADYLDKKCGAIDAAIAEAKKGIEEYKAWKKSLIFEAVTGKRRVGAFNAKTQSRREAEKMKHSGIPWIGAIPERWKLARLKNCAKVFGRIGFRGYTTADIVNEGEGALSLSPSNLKDIRMDYAKRTYISWSKYEESPEIKVCKGDIVFVKTGSSYGKACIVDDMPCEATLNPQLVVLKCFSCHNRYLNYYLQTPLIKYQVELIVSGGTIPTMSQEKMGCWKIILPPLSEQQAIADYLDEKCAAIDAMVAEKEALIADLEAYKKSLIYETVTGKREVA